MRLSQGKVEESEAFHRKALKQYQSTIRNRHHRTADVCHKLAQHCLRRDLFGDAMDFVAQALKVWYVDQEKYAPEIARTTFLKAKLHFASGDEQNATALFRKAISMRCKLRPNAGEDEKSLQEEDFDEVVTFWSR